MAPGTGRAPSWVLALLLLSLAPSGAGASTALLRALPPEQVLRFQPRTFEEAARLPSAPGSVLGRPVAPALGSLGTDASASSAGRSGEWSEWGPPVRTGHSLVLDTRRRRLLVVGGWYAEDPQRTVWAYDLLTRAWSVVGQVPAPAQPFDVPIGAVYDSLGDRLALARFLRSPAGTYSVEVLLSAPGSVSSWQSTVVPGEREGPWHMGLALDPGRQRLMVPGLWSPAHGRHDVLIVPLVAPAAAVFSPTTGGQPSPAPGGVAAFDAARDAIVVLSRLSGDFEVSRLAAAGPHAWTPVAIADPGFCSLARTMVRDELADQLIITDEHGAAVAVPAAGGGVARALAPQCVDRHEGEAVVFDAATRQLWRHGGRSLTYTMPPLQWLKVDGAPGWQDEGSPGLASRIWHTLVVDAATRRAIVFGGWTAGVVPFQTMSRPLDGGEDWKPLATGAAARPRVRFLHSLVLDPVRRQLVLFGGQATDGSGDLLGDLWRLPLADGAVWEQVAVPPGGPGPRRLMSAFYDAARDRIILAGGDDLVKPFSDVWELRLSPVPAWRAIGTRGVLGLPYGEIWHDPVRGDGWVLPRAPWLHHLAFTADSVIGERRELDPDAFRFMAPVAFDAARREVIGFQDNGSTLHLGAPATLAPASADRWTPALLGAPGPGMRVLAAMAPDAAADRLLLVGGYDDGDRYFADSWRLQWMTPVAVSAALAFAEAGASATTLAWQVLGAAGARGEVERSDDGTAWQRRGEARLDGADRLVFDDEPLPRGGRAAYRLRVSAGAERFTTAATWLERPVDGAVLMLAAAENPARGPLRLRLSLAGDEAASLALFDANGRRIESVRLAPSQREWTFAAPRAPGLYLARLQQGREVRTVKLAVSR